MNRWGIALLAVTGAILFALATRWGIGISPDAVTYLGSARNFLEGRGLTLPCVDSPQVMTHYPPLYPLVLAGMTKIFGDLSLGARILNGLLYAANILILGLATTFYLNSLRMGLLAAFLFMTSTGIFTIHAMAWSEPLFLFLTWIGFLSLLKHLESPDGRALLVSAIAIGLAMVTRYVGMACLLTAVYAIFTMSRRPLREQIKNALVLLVVASLPTILWMLRNYLLAGDLAHRTWGFHLLSVSHVRQLAHTLSLWFFPKELPSWFRACCLIWPGALAGVLFVRHRSVVLEWFARQPPFIRLLVNFSMIYSLFLLVSIVFFSLGTPLDSRILSPLFTVLIVLSLSLGEECLRSDSLPASWKQGLRGLLWMMLLTFPVRFGLTVISAHREGIDGYNSSSWQKSPVMNSLRTLLPQAPIYTNAPAAVCWQVGKGASLVPITRDVMHWRANPDFETQMETMAAALKNKGAVLAFFRDEMPFFYMPKEEALQKRFALQKSVDSGNAALYVGGKNRE